MSRDAPGIPESLFAGGQVSGVGGMDLVERQVTLGVGFVIFILVPKIFTCAAYLGVGDWVTLFVDDLNLHSGTRRQWKSDLLLDGC
jgi:hypothetical protein